MMENGHPDELELLAHADERPRSPRAREVAAHVAGCAACAATVRELQAARTALRAAPRLELPAARREAISAALDGQPRRRRSLVSPRRVGALLAPVAVLAALVVAVGALREPAGEVGGRDAAGPAEVRPTEDAAGEAAAGEEGGLTAPESSGDADPSSALAGPGPVASVAGPPAEVLRLLRAEGLTARVTGGRIVVSDASAQEVLDALRGRRAGGVQVVLE